MIRNNWIWAGNAWYYAKDDCSIYQNCIFDVDGSKYYAQAGGSLRQNGWVEADNKWYFAGPGGGFYKKCWVNVGGAWYYAKDDCSIYQNCIFDVDGSKYYAQTGGNLRQNGWVKSENKWYFAGPGGGFYRNRWVKVGGLWYYAQAECDIFHSGWLLVDGLWYYARQGGDIIQNDTIDTESGKYYLLSSGEMAADMFVWHDGRYMYFGEDGKYDGTIKWTGSLVDIARSQLGTYTGEKYWTYYEGTPFVNGSVTPWCGCFIAWCLKQAGIINAIHVGNMASVPYWLRYFDRTGKWDSMPNPGDIVVYDWKPYDGIRQGFHVGIVEKVKDGLVYTIEGNTGTSYYGAVLRRVRAIGNIYTIGYGKLY